MIFKRILLAAALLSSLAACNNLEHRSDLPPRQPLPALEAGSWQPSLVWGAQAGVGSAGSHTRLQLISIQDQLATVDANGLVTVLQAADGKLAWQLSSYFKATAGPTYCAPWLVLGTRQGKIVSLNAKERRLGFEADVPGEILAPVACDAERLFVHTLNDGVFALSKRDGVPLWRYSEQPASLVLRRISKPLVGENLVFVGFTNGRLAALDKQTGKVQWEREINMPRGRSELARMVDISSDPILHRGLLYVVSYQGQLQALHPEDGELAWAYDISSISGLCAEGQQVYVVDAVGRIKALQTNTGKLAWEQAALMGRKLTSPVYSKGHIIVADEEGYVHWLRARDGKPVARVKADGHGVDASPLVIKDRVYVLGRSGLVRAYQ